MANQRIPEGLCQCGCGGHTGTYAATRPARGQTKGQPIKFLTGHSGRPAYQTTQRPEYTVWVNMRQRCTNPKSDQFKNYGARGITVCDRWLSFKNFFADMGERPPGKTLERSDVNGNYTADNCVWATPLEQGANMRKTVRLTMNGRTLHLRAWAREVGISPKTIINRVRLLGWSIEDALTRPVNGHRRDPSL